MQSRLLILSMYIYISYSTSFCFSFLHFRLQSLLVDDEDASAASAAAAATAATAALTPHSAQRVELTAAARRDLAFAPALDDIVERRCVPDIWTVPDFCARFYACEICGSS